MQENSVRILYKLINIILKLNLSSILNWKQLASWVSCGFLHRVSRQTTLFKIFLVTDDNNYCLSDIRNIVAYLVINWRGEITFLKPFHSLRWYNINSPLKLSFSEDSLTAETGLTIKKKSRVISFNISRKRFAIKSRGLPCLEDPAQSVIGYDQITQETPN